MADLDKTERRLNTMIDVVFNRRAKRILSKLSTDDVLSLYERGNSNRTEYGSLIAMMCINVLNERYPSAMSQWYECKSELLRKFIIDDPKYKEGK